MELNSSSLTRSAKPYMTWPLIHVSDLIFHPSLPGPLCSSHTGFMLAPFTCLWASGLASSAKMLSSWNMVPLPTPQASTLRSPSQKRLPEPPKITTTPAHTLSPYSALFFFIPKITYLFFPFLLEHKLHKIETLSFSLL